MVLSNDGDREIARTLLGRRSTILRRWPFRYHPPKSQEGAANRTANCACCPLESRVALAPRSRSGLVGGDMRAALIVNDLRRSISHWPAAPGKLSIGSDRQRKAFFVGEGSAQSFGDYTSGTNTRDDRRRRANAWRAFGSGLRQCHRVQEVHRGFFQPWPLQRRNWRNGRLLGWLSIECANEAPDPAAQAVTAMRPYKPPWKGAGETAPRLQRKSDGLLAVSARALAKLGTPISAYPEQESARHEIAKYLGCRLKKCCLPMAPMG